VTVLIGTGSARATAEQIARSVLSNPPGLDGLSRLSAIGLLAQPGLGPAMAARIAAALELGRRVALHATAPRASLGSFDDVAAWARPRLAALEHEEVWLLALDGRNGVKSARRIAQGGMHGCALTTRDILAPALRDAASAIVLVHNHPSGDPHPSPEDVSMTSHVARACDLLGMPLLDHVIVARGGAASLLTSGAMG
jgi:DNA repair protein RadC